MFTQVMAWSLGGPLSTEAQKCFPIYEAFARIGLYKVLVEVC